MIEIKATGDTTLKTKGKYCDDDILVKVPTPKLQDKTITENGTYQADSGYDGLGSVTVEIASGGGNEGIVFRNLKESLETGVSLNTIMFSCSYTVA